MNPSNWIRKFHRWTSIAFVLGVIVYIIAMQRGQPAAWVGALAALPLILLLLTGLYLFVLPYAIKWRAGRRVTASV
jgi:hypothetical protein